MMSFITKAQQSRTRRSASAPTVEFFVCVVFFVTSSCLGLDAHSGPPFPILTDRVAGAYKVSIWTDPDVTDDRVPAGRFWVTLQPAASDVLVSIKPLDRDGATETAAAPPVNGDAQRHFVALLMDHEGRFGVHVRVDGPAGRADVDTWTDATYDLRPRPILMLVFVMPFVLVGVVWGKLLLKRRGLARKR